MHPKSLQNDVVVQELQNEILVFNLRTNNAYCLNQTAAFVWQHADGKTSAGQIAALLHEKLKTPVDESIVWLALERLEKDGLLEEKVAAPQMIAGMNRRELIKTFGKSAAFALPLVLMLTAPTAANAASAAGGIGQSCSSGSQCASGSCASNGTCCVPNGSSCSSSGQCCDVVNGSSSAGCRNGTCVPGRPGSS